MKRGIEDAFARGQAVEYRILPRFTFKESP
jgi:hypothetical protein